MLPTISDMTSTTISSIDVKEVCIRGNLEEVGNRREGVNERFMLIGLILSASGVFFVNVNGREFSCCLLVRQKGTILHPHRADCRHAVD